MVFSIVMLVFQRCKCGGSISNSGWGNPFLIICGWIELDWFLVAFSEELEVCEFAVWMSRTTGTNYLRDGRRTKENTPLQCYSQWYRQKGYFVQMAQKTIEKTQSWPTPAPWNQSSLEKIHTARWSVVKTPEKPLIVTPHTFVDKCGPQDE